MRTATRTRMDRLEAEKAAWVIEEFARWVAETPGVWSVTIRRCELSGPSVDLHLVVHAEIEGPGEPAGGSEC